MTQDQIKSLACKKHVKIYKMKQLGLSNKEIAIILETNTGHIYNVLKDYAKNPELIEKSELISA